MQTTSKPNRINGDKDTSCERRASKPVAVLVYCHRSGSLVNVVYSDGRTCRRDFESQEQALAFTESKELYNIHAFIDGLPVGTVGSAPSPCRERRS